MSQIGTQKVVIGFMGILLGCAGATVIPVRSPWAQPPSGQWACYDTPAFHRGVEVAAKDDQAIAATTALNQVATHVPSGSIVAFRQGVLLCVKH